MVYGSADPYPIFVGSSCHGFAYFYGTKEKQFFEKLVVGNRNFKYLWLYKAKRRIRKFE